MLKVLQQFMVFSILIAIEKALCKQQNVAETTIDVFILHIFGNLFFFSLSKLVPVCYTVFRRDGRVDYCGCLENSWVNRPGGSNPSPSVKAMAPETN